MSLSLSDLILSLWNIVTRCLKSRCLPDRCCPRSASCLSLRSCRMSLFTTIMASSMSLLGLGRLTALNTARRILLNPTRYVHSDWFLYFTYRCITMCLLLRSPTKVDWTSRLSAMLQASKWLYANCQRKYSHLAKLQGSSVVWVHIVSIYRHYIGVVTF